MRILIVEDDQNSRLVLQRFVEPYAECATASDGAEALDRFIDAYETQVPFDLIFLDIMMPKLDGQEFLSLVRDYEQARGMVASQGVKVIMTSALDDEGNIFCAHVSGCYNYLIKPLERAKVLEQLRSLGVSIESTRANPADQ